MMEAFGTLGNHIGAAIDTETTGLSSETDHIIEVGVRLFRYELPSGKITEQLETHAALHDPGIPISLEIQRITGIKQETVAGKKIEWEKIDALLAQAEIIIAHNAGFDRGFVDRKSQVSPEKVWGCSSQQIDWKAKGFRNAKLGDLCHALGIAHEPHRAMSDVDAMVKLIGSDDVFTGRCYLAEILESASQEVVWLSVDGKTYDQRDLLKAHGFRWNSANKHWGKIVLRGELEKQRNLVKTLIPGTALLCREISVKDRFKSTV